MSLAKQIGEDPRNLIVNYIPTPVHDAELRQLFEQYGELESARVIIDRNSNHPKGYGFVKFKEEKNAQFAMEQMNGFEILNKRLKVTCAKGPHNAAIDRHTARLQQMAVSQPANTSSVYPVNPSAQSPAHQTTVKSPMQSASNQLHTYIIIDGNGVAMTTATVQPPQVSSQTQPVTYPSALGQGPLPAFVPLSAGGLNPQDPMNRDSCTFSLSGGDGTHLV